MGLHRIPGAGAYPCCASLCNPSWQLLLTSAVLFDQFFQLRDRVDHMDALTAVEACRLEDPNVLPNEVAHGHDQTGRF